MKPSSANMQKNIRKSNLEKRPKFIFDCVMRKTQWLVGLEYQERPSQHPGGQRRYPKEESGRDTDSPQGLSVLGVSWKRKETESVWEDEREKESKPGKLVTWQAGEIQRLEAKNHQQRQLLVGGLKGESERQDLDKARQRPGLTFRKDRKDQ